MRYSSLPRMWDFEPSAWKVADLQPASNGSSPGWYEVDLSDLSLQDGKYEYEFIIVKTDGNCIEVPDPFSEEITRFGGYRGVFGIKNGKRVREQFSWDNEIPPNVRLPQNNELVIYELPLRWVDPGEDGYARQVGLGTIDKAIFELLGRGEGRAIGHIPSLGTNAIELLPIQDSPDTLNWGYGNRFFFTPDIDMGSPFDLKLFIKICHQLGIRVIMDIVMNHSKKCPLEELAFEWYYIKPESEELTSDGKATRDGWGGKAFRYREPANGSYMAREFHFRMAEFWIREYHIDGFRIDEFKGINNWDFIRSFRYRAIQQHRLIFPNRPFIIVAEDSWRRANATEGDYFPASADPSPEEERRLRVTDAIWDFDFRDELRRIASDTLNTIWGQPGRHERVQAMLKGEQLWDGEKWRPHGFSDIAQRITYSTSHDVQNENEKRLYSFYLDQARNQWNDARDRFQIDPACMPDFESLAREMIVTSFALMLTCRGIPMFLAGEEFADLHDLEQWDWRKKMSDPVDWYRRQEPGHAHVLERVKDLIKLRVNPDMLALHRNELEFFGMDGIASGFQSDFDNNTGGRVFAYCRTGGQPLGKSGQIAIVANCGWTQYPVFKIRWPWTPAISIREHGGKGQALPTLKQGGAEFELDRFQTRVFKLSA